MLSGAKHLLLGMSCSSAALTITPVRLVGHPSLSRQATGRRSGGARRGASQQHGHSDNEKQRRDGGEQAHHELCRGRGKEGQHPDGEQKHQESDAQAGARNVWV
jgi:hypothetical protein